MVHIAFNSVPLALHHNFMNIDDPARSSRMSDKSDNLTWRRQENTLNIVKFLKVHS